MKTQRSLKLWTCALLVISVLTMIPPFLAHYHLYHPIRIVDPMIIPSIERMVSYRSIFTACLILGSILLLRKIASKRFVWLWAGAIILGTIFLYWQFLGIYSQFGKSFMAFNLYDVHFWCGSSIFYLIYLYLPHRPNKNYLDQE